jgi:hypothetical protein
LEDFPDETMKDDEISQYAARIARANITQDTRDGHIRYVLWYSMVVQAEYMVAMPASLSTTSIFISAETLTGIH